jgi:hypothetical protein
MKNSVRQVDVAYSIEHQSYAIVVRDVKQRNVMDTSINETKTGSLASLLKSPDDVFVNYDDAEKLMTALWQAGCRPNNLSSIDTLEYHLSKVSEFSTKLKQFKDNL